MKEKLTVLTLLIPLLLLTFATEKGNKEHLKRK
jgi:hypothetical protein